MVKIRSRRARHVWLSATSWRQRLVFWLGALVIGLVAVGFALAADHVQEAFDAVVGRWPYLPLALSPLMFGLSAWATVRWFPNSQGSGIPQAIAARHLTDPESRRKLLAPRTMIGKILLTLLGLAGGGSIGREGPTVQVGAALMVACGTVAGLAGQRGLVLAGSAAGVSAAFNTPLAGIVFAIEEMARGYESRASGLVMVAVILAGISSLAVTGNYEYFGHTLVTLDEPGAWIGVLACGVVGGLAGGLFSRAVIEAGRLLPVWLKGVATRRPVAFAATCGLIIAVIGVAAGGLTFGTGYHAARMAIDGTADLPWWYAPAKLAATAVSSVSGIPGGLFAPSLSVGAGIGSALTPLMEHVPVAAMVMLGMVGYFAGVTQSPMTAFVIVMEMTGNHGMVVPLMASAMIAYGVSRMVCPVPLYHALARRFIAAARPPVA
ncbi:chloride channel protein [Skermanella stibiiresistens SB22]|uniref:Chloride channel protein n=1 Tax=Skermanella stibiiresistens SB22 TaxID=1385369 RepID=W9H9N2_9PROT|nr:chloride channel protein [Skermanella stibiiresistens]EWY42629.1 chloride channel protein [Skermanella stibiiresistens SB22]